MKMPLTLEMRGDEDYEIETKLEGTSEPGDEKTEQGEDGATLIRRGRRCLERGEEACYVPDMNLYVGRPSAGTRRRTTSAWRSRIGASPRSGANSTRTSMPREGGGVMSCPRHESTDVHTSEEPIGVITAI